MSKQDEKSDKSDRNAYLQFRRIIKIDYLLANDVYPSSKRLMEDDDIGCSRATLMRDIEFLRDEMRAPIE